MKYCVTCAWPNASLSVLSMTCGWMPKRAAASRLMVMVSSGASFCASVATSASCGSVLSLVDEPRRPGVQLVQIGILQHVLELAARDAAADGDVLRRLQEQPGARDLGELRAQPVDDLRGRGVAVVAQLQADDEAAGILGVAVARAEERSEVGDVGILRDHRRTAAAGSPSSLSGETSWPASEMPRIMPMSWVGKKPFGMITNSTPVMATVARNTSRVAN